MVKIKTTIFNKDDIKKRLSNFEIDESFYDKICEDLNIVFHLSMMSFLINHLSENEKNILENSSLENTEKYFSDYPDKIPTISEDEIFNIKESIFTDYIKFMK